MQAWRRRAAVAATVTLMSFLLTACAELGQSRAPQVAAAAPVAAEPAPPPAVIEVAAATEQGTPLIELEQRVAAQPRNRRWSCVPYARNVSGLEIRGDAWTWWAAAAGRYERGDRPVPGAVLVLSKTRRLRRGHVAVVLEVVDDREIIVTHANWQGGRVSERMRVQDVSPDNDWSQTRFWWTPSNRWGIRVYPASGFIYPGAVAPQSPIGPEPLTRVAEVPAALNELVAEGAATAATRPGARPALPGN